MAILPIRVYPDPVLRETCREITDIDPELRQLAADMVETMHAAPGVGLAAPQVGLPIRLAVVDTSVGQDPAAQHVLVNPRIVEHWGAQVDVEGCLSLPGLTEKIRRPLGIRLEWQDLDSEPREIEAEGFLARALCHELDHLDGILFIDHLSGLRRDRMRRRLKRLAEKQGNIYLGSTF